MLAHQEALLAIQKRRLAALERQVAAAEAAAAAAWRKTYVVAVLALALLVAVATFLYIASRPERVVEKEKAKIKAELLAKKELDAEEKAAAETGWQQPGGRRRPRPQAHDLV